MSTTSKILVSLVALLVIGGGIYYWMVRKPPPVHFVWQKVGRGDLTQVVNATGLLNPVVLSPVGSQVSGIVWKLRADYNDHVKKGQVLLELDPAIFTAQVDQQKANLAAALAAVAKAKADLRNNTLIARRNEDLVKDHYVAESDRDTAVANRDGSEALLVSAEAQVQQARASLRNAELNLKNSVILSPVDGVVIARSVELGQAVAAAFTAPNLFSIAEDLTKMQVLANVDEADIGMVQLGQTAQFTVDAFRGRHFKATVSQVRNAPQTVQNVVTYVVVLDVDNSALLLRPGMTANVRIEVAHRDGVLLVPNAALRFKPPADMIKGHKKGERGRWQKGPEGSGSGERAGNDRAAGGDDKAGEGDKAPDDKSGERPGGGHRHRRDAEGLGKKGEPGLPEGVRGSLAAALAKNLFANQATVYVQDGPLLRGVPVVAGITDGMQTELISGIDEGAEVASDTVRQPGSGAQGASGPGMGPPGMGGPGGGGGGFRRGGI